MSRRLRFAINGFGRVGRALVRAMTLRSATGDSLPLELVAINDTGDADSLLYLSRYDSTHGIFPGHIWQEDNRLCFADQRPRLLQQEQVSQLPWHAMQVDYVLELSGAFRSHSAASEHLAAGAQRVILGAVPFDSADRFIVHGVNDADLQDNDKVISAASCTTHCIAPLLAAIDTHFGIEQALLKEIHAVTSDQTPLDHPHRDPRRGRAAGYNIIPTSCSAVSAVQQVLPHLQGRIEGHSVRVPTINVALAELTLNLAQAPANETHFNDFLCTLANRHPQQLAINNAPLVSSDFNGRREAAIVDLTLTHQMGQLVQLCAWYDNETGYANRLLDWLSSLAASTVDPDQTSVTTKG